MKDDREARTAKDLINAQLTGLSSRLTGIEAAGHSIPMLTKDVHSGDLLTRALLEVICLKLLSHVDEIPARCTR